MVNVVERRRANVNAQFYITVSTGFFKSITIINQVSNKISNFVKI